VANCGPSGGVLSRPILGSRELIVFRVRGVCPYEGHRHFQWLNKGKGGGEGDFASLPVSVVARERGGQGVGTRCGRCPKSIGTGKGRGQRRMRFFQCSGLLLKIRDLERLRELSSGFGKRRHCQWYGVASANIGPDWR